MEVEKTFFDAIHATPGDTPGEKFKYISTLAHNFPIDGEFNDLVRSGQLPKLMLPLFQLEVARKTDNCRLIADSLKSEDSLVINKALLISRFFEAHDENIVNPLYFRENLLPYISMNTRQKIIKRLAIHLPPEKSQLAAKMFDMFYDMYGLDQAYPLLTACSADYIHDICTRLRLVLPAKIIKMLHRKNPKAVTQYLLAIARENSSHETSRKKCISKYHKYLNKLIKTDLELFVEIFESCFGDINIRYLSKKRTRIFMKNAKPYWVKSPRKYKDHLSWDMVDTETMKIIFAELMPLSEHDFDSSYTLRYLKKFSEPEKSSLLIKTFEEKYGNSIFDDTSRITPELLMYLPIEQRNLQAKRIFVRDPYNTSSKNNYKTAWRCYLPTCEVISKIKREITTCPSILDRSRLLAQIIYCCRVNEDSEALLEFLKYFNTKHKNEPSHLFESFFADFCDIYDGHLLDATHHDVLKSIVEKCYEKRILRFGNTICRFVVNLIHLELKLGLAIDETMTLFLELRFETVENGSWNMITHIPEYEEICLKKCIELATNECHNADPNHLWFKDTYNILHNVLLSIEQYRKRHKKNIDSSKMIEEMGYPDLLKHALQSVVSEKKNCYYLWKHLMFDCSTNTYQTKKKITPQETNETLPQQENINQKSYAKTINTKDTLSNIYSTVILHELKLNNSIDAIIDNFLQHNVQACPTSSWNVITNTPEREEMCLKKCIELVMREYPNASRDHIWFRDTYQILHNVLLSICEYRERHKKHVELCKVIEEMGYPFLLENTLQSVVTGQTDYYHKWMDLMFECSLDSYEMREKVLQPKVLDRDLRSHPNTGRALSLLKKNPHTILHHSNYYLSECKSTHQKKRVQRFIKYIKWHTRIAPNWLEECKRDFENSKSIVSLYILGSLMDGKSFSKMISPFALMKSPFADEKYQRLVLAIPYVMNRVNPPPLLTTLSELCKGEDFAHGLKALPNICRRVTTDKVVPFLQNLSGQKITIKKHCLRLLYTLVSIEDSAQSLFSQWTQKNHSAIRAFLVDEIHNLFVKNPLPSTFNVFRDCIADLTLTEEEHLPRFLVFKDIPDVYLAEYITILLKAVDRLIESGYAPYKAVETMTKIINGIHASRVPESFCINLIQRYLFYPNPLVISATMHFSIDSYVLSESSKVEERLEALANILVETIKTKWDVPHPKVSYFYPVNYAIKNLFEYVLCEISEGERFLDTLWEIFKTALAPRRYIRLDLLFHFKKEQFRDPTPYGPEFGRRIGLIIPTLVDIYSQFAISVMVSILKLKFSSEITPDFIKGLLEADNPYSVMMAAQLAHDPSVNIFESKRHELLSMILNNDEMSADPALTAIVEEGLSFSTATNAHHYLVQHEK